MQHRSNPILNSFALVDVIKPQNTNNNWSFAHVFNYPGVPQFLLKILVYFCWSQHKQSNKRFHSISPFLFYIYCTQNLTHMSLVSERRAEKSPLFSFYMNIFDTLNISFLLQVPILGKNCSDLVMFDIVI